MTTIQIEGFEQVMEKLNELNRKIDAMSKPDMPEFLTVEQVAEMKGKNAETIRRWARQGKLKFVPGVRPYRFKASDINPAS